MKIVYKQVTFLGDGSCFKSKDSFLTRNDIARLSCDFVRMIILEDDLEKLMVSKEPTDLTLEGYQDLCARLHQLQPHMQASSGCWEDTVSQVERMLRRANACPGEQRDDTHTHTPWNISADAVLF